MLKSVQKVEDRLLTRVFRLKGAFGKKGKRYKKLKLHAMKLAEDAEDMAELIVEKDIMKTKLDAMKEMLAEVN